MSNFSSINPAPLVKKPCFSKSKNNFNHDMFERSKFMLARSLWKPCARAHAHSLEGTLPTSPPASASAATGPKNPSPIDNSAKANGDFI